MIWVKKTVFSLALFCFVSSCEKTEVINGETVSNPSEDNATDNHPGDSGDTHDFRITMNVSDGIRGNRASVDEDQIGNSGLRLRWDEGDKVRMMVGSNAGDVTACDFTLVDGPSLGTGNFEYVGKEVQTDYYYGVYPPMEIGMNGNVQLYVPVDGSIRQAAADDSRHLGQYRPMYAPPVQQSGNGNKLTGVVFRHLTSLIVFKVTNLSDEIFNLKSVELFTADNNAVFYSSASFNPQSDSEVAVSGNPVSSVSMNVEADGMQLASKEMKKVYLPVLPSGDFSASQLKVKAVTDKGEFITDIPLAASQTLKRFKAGSYCIFNLKKTQTGLTVEIEILGWEDGDIVDVPVL